jgi:DME family drug/metabolite transporter
MSTTKPVTPTHTWQGLVLVCLAGVVWGTIGTAVQLVHERSALSPLTIGAYRAVAAVVVLLVAVGVLGRLDACRVLLRTRWRRATAVGVLTATFQLLFFVAVVATGVGVATVVCLGFAPVLLLVVTSVRRRRIPSVGHAVTVGTAVVGLLLVSTVGAGGDTAPHAGLGILAALGSGAAYALSAEVASTLSQGHDPLSLTAVTMCVAAAVLIPVGTVPVHLAGGTTRSSDVPSWLLIAYLGVVTMALAYALLFAGLRTTPSGTAVVATLVEPVTAVLLAGLVLREGLTPAGIVGSLLIVAAIGSLGRRQEEPPPQ